MWPTRPGILRLRFTRPEVRSLVLRTLIWGTRGVKGKAQCAISVVCHSFDSPSASLGASAKQGRLLQRTCKDGLPGDYGAVRTPCVAGGGVDKHGVLRLHFVIGFANNKVPLRMTGSKRVPISQHADGN